VHRLARAFAEAAQESPASGRSGSESAGGFEHETRIGAEPGGDAGEQRLAAFREERVGRVGEDQVKWRGGRRRPGEDIGGENLAERGGVGCAEGFGDGGEVGANDGGGGGMVFHPGDMDGAAAEGFEAVGAGAGEEVEDARAGDSLGQGGKTAARRASVAGRNSPRRGSWSWMPRA